MKVFNLIQSRFKSFHIILFFLFILSSLFLLVVVSNTNDLPINSSYPQPIFAQGTNYDWPQVQNTPQRTGYTPEVLGTNIAISWTYRFWPEKVYPQVQAIIYQGKIFVGTEHGNMYAFDEQQSKTQKKAVISWKHPIGSPILGSVAAGDGKIFFGALDGSVYALNASDGSEVWKNKLIRRLGFSTAPVLAEGKVMLGGQNGVFYALDITDGHVVWQYEETSSGIYSAPILQTAAYNNSKIFFGSMNMYVYALNTTDGTRLWRSQKLNGMALKDYWPVVHQGRVLVRSLAGGKNFYALDEDTGDETITLPQFYGFTQNGATTPPAIDRDGRLVVPVPRPDPLRPGYYTYGSCWGILDLGTQQIIKTLNIQGQSIYYDGCGNSDESENVSSAQNLIIVLHTFDQEGIVGWRGAFNLENQSWIVIPVPSPWPRYNTQGGGGNPASIANGMFYHISVQNLVARSAN